MSMMKNMYLFCFLFLLMPGCNSKRPDEALVAYQKFAMSVRYGSPEGVWSVLTPESQQMLAERLGVDGQDQDAIIKQLGLRPTWHFEYDEPNKAVIVQEGSDGSRRVVEGPLGGVKWRFVIRRSAEEWRLDLTASGPVDLG